MHPEKGWGVGLALVSAATPSSDGYRQLEGIKKQNDGKDKMRKLQWRGMASEGCAGRSAGSASRCSVPDGHPGGGEVAGGGLGG